MPSDILSDSEIMDVFLPTIRADFALTDYDFDTSVKLKTNASLFAGDQDYDAPIEGVSEWEKHILGYCEALEFKGKHLFIDEHREEVIEKVVTILRKYY